ncbi:hypothetical protein SANA_01820 [Gottschalkiaceae bacterium SANA]|nr:hypothetical protein SANA_01820 [Gottschalkiaceae bacterium SANA]
MKKNQYSRLIGIILVLLMLVGCQANVPVSEAIAPIAAEDSVDEEAFTHEPEKSLNVDESVEQLDLPHLADREVVPFEEAIIQIMDNRLKTIQEKDYDGYMSAITNKDPYFYNEQERWFMEMTDPMIQDLSIEILSTEIIDAHTGIVRIRQRHKASEFFDFEYPLLFKYEEDRWMDYGYNFAVLKTDRFKVKYMAGESRVDEFKDMLDLAYDNLEGVYQERPHDNFEMKLFLDRELLRQRTVPTNGWLFTGWSEPDESLKIYTGHPTGYSGYPGVVQHELVHHITIRICNNNLPVWLLEGIAMYDGTAYYDFSDSSLLSRMTKAGVSQTIGQLESLDVSSDLTGEQIVNFYNTSYLLVKYICDSYGHEVLMDLFYEAGKKPFHDSTLNDTFESNNQKTANEVFQSVLGVTKEEISTEYLEWLETTDVFHSQLR